MPGVFGALWKGASPNYGNVTQNFALEHLNEEAKIMHYIYILKKFVFILLEERLRVLRATEKKQWA